MKGAYDDLRLLAERLPLKYYSFTLKATSQTPFERAYKLPRDRSLPKQYDYAAECSLLQEIMLLETRGSLIKDTGKDGERKEVWGYYYMPNVWFVAVMATLYAKG